MPKFVKITTKLNIFNWLFPHSCRGCGRIGPALCDCCQKNIYFLHHMFCPACKKPIRAGKCRHHPSEPPIFALGLRQGLLDQIIHEYKYDSVRALSLPLAQLLNQILPPPVTKTYIVPLPTISRHIRERGQDHTAKIAKNLAHLHPNYQVCPLLTRANNTIQVGANRQTRLAQAESAYQINPKYKIDRSATYLLFDDVWTTGASMRAAIKKLRENGVSNIIVAILAISEF